MYDNVGNDTNIDLENISTGRLMLSARSQNCLKRAGVKNIKSFLEVSEEDIRNIRGLGEKSVDEILNAQRVINENGLEYYLYNNASGFIDLYENDDIDTESDIRKLNLSVRSTTALINHGIEKVADLLKLTEEDVDVIRNVGEKSKKEILMAVDNVKKEMFRNEYSDENEQEKKNQRTLLCKYYESHDFPVRDLSLSVRPYNALSDVGVVNFSQLIKMSRYEISKIKNMGRKSVDEILFKIDEITDPVKNAIANGELTEENIDRLSSEEIESHINDIFYKNEPSGVAAQEIISGFDGKADEETVKAVIEKMIADGRVKVFEEVESKTEKDGFGVYDPDVENKEEKIKYIRNYPSFAEVVEHLSDNREKEILRARLQGKTLEEISDSYDLTRERVRQIQQRAIEKTKKILRELYSVNRFKEDKFKLLYIKYNIEKSIWDNYICDDIEQYHVLQLLYDRGDMKIDDAVDDVEISIALRKRVQKYLDRDYIIFDGHRIKKERTSIESFIISRYCIDETKYSEFLQKYDNFLTDIGYPDDGNLRTNESLYRTRYNALSDSMKVLWKPGMKLRYYDIAANDYSDLLEGIALDQYSNVEISALKIFEAKTELMTEYDIRDEYELHNLLKKIKVESMYPDMELKRNPTISFGKFDRDYEVFEMMVDMAPVTREDLIYALHDKYGYAESTIAANWLECIDLYYHKGIFNIDHQNMPDEQTEGLLNELNDDFYRIDDIKKIYLKKYPESDASMINPYNLKKMGFMVYNVYVTRNFDSAYAYFKSLLTDSDIVNIGPYLKKFTGITEFTSTLSKIKSDYTIIEFEKDNYISSERLKKFGITDIELRSFCDDVYGFADNKFFTLKKLNDEGFKNRLEFLGFGYTFYSSILREDERFGYVKYADQVLFKKNVPVYSFKRKDLIYEILIEKESVDIDDLIALIKDVYGIVFDVSDIVYAVDDTDMYYDRIMRKVYIEYETYYDEI